MQSKRLGSVKDQVRPIRQGSSGARQGPARGARPTCASPDPDCANYPPGTDWTGATGQILSPGDAWAASQLDSNGGCGGSPLLMPSLLTVEPVGGNYELWLYQTKGCGTQLQNPIELGSSGWGHMDLIAAGMVNGTLTLWARDRNTGTQLPHQHRPQRLADTRQPG